MDYNNPPTVKRDLVEDYKKKMLACQSKLEISMKHIDIENVLAVIQAMVESPLIKQSIFSFKKVEKKFNYLKHSVGVRFPDLARVFSWSYTATKGGGGKLWINR